MPDNHTNFAVSTVATAPSPATSGTTLVVQAGDGAKFPTGSFNATVWPVNTQPTTANAEIVRCTVTTDTFTITRAQEGSSARTIVVGDQIAATITAKTLTDVETAVTTGDTASVATAEAFATAAVAALSTVYQPLDSDLTAIAALSTTSFGRSLLTAADAAALRADAGLGTAATHASTDFDAAGAAAAAQAASQPLDSDLTAIAALTTTSFGRSLLTLADAAALLSAAGALGATAAAGGDLTGNYPNPTLATAGGGAAGPTGSTSVIPVVTVDAKGRVTALGSASPTIDTIGAGTDITTNNVSTSKHGLTPKLPNDNTKFLDGTGAYSTPTASPSPGGLAVYGDGSDGTVTFDGSTTILGMAPSSSVYTAVRDLYLAAGTINNGVTLKMAGFVLYVQGTLTNNGTIHNNGANGANPAGGAAGAAGTLGAAGTGGGAGGTAGGIASAASTLNIGGRGGQGGNGSSAAGPVAGTVSAPGATVPIPHGFVGALVLSYAGWLAGVAVGFRCGTGGSGGSGDSTNAGGGGGGSGGPLLISAKTIAGTGAIQSRGGNGANGAGTGNTGGGGGGGGGWAAVVSSSVSAGAVSGQTIDTTGGTGGTLHGTGTNGANGSAGNTYLLPN